MGSIQPQGKAWMFQRSDAPQRRWESRCARPAIPQPDPSTADWPIRSAD